MFRILVRWLDAEQKATPPGSDPTAPSKGPEGLDGAIQTLFDFHPVQLHRYLEQAWAVGGYVPAVSPYPTPEKAFLGDEKIVDALRLPREILNTLPSGIGAPPAATPYERPFYSTKSPPGLDQKQPWEHLIYAYLIENTGVLPIFRRVVEWYAAGERLEVPNIETRTWLRSTEELFLREPPPFHISSVSSWARPDLEASRRNAYWRMFGMDLNHGGPNGRPYQYVRGAGGNADFVPQWESFLQEVWQGYINRMNSSGENYSDPEAVANRADGLAQIMRVRRENGNLTREEFFFTAMMSWFHLTLEANTSVVKDLKADSTTPEERLRKIGERVGIAPHPKARNFFEMAEPASTLLRFVELQRFSEASTAAALFDKAPDNKVRDDALVVINHWSMATGRDLKLRRPNERPLTRMASAVSSPSRVDGMAPRAGVSPVVVREDELVSTNGQRA
jgi:hypothetical protein